MYVKSEPRDDFDIPMDLMTDMETNLLREEIFGNRNIFPDFSESSSDDDLFPKFSSESEFGSLVSDYPNWTGRSSSLDSSSSTAENSFDGSSHLPLVLSELSDDYGKLLDKQVKSEGPTLEGKSADSDASPAHYWDMFWDDETKDVKPVVQVPETPPVTPAQSDTSPPRSPEPLDGITESIIITSCTDESQDIPQPRAVVVGGSTAHSPSLLASGDSSTIVKTVRSTDSSSLPKQVVVRMDKTAGQGSSSIRIVTINSSGVSSKGPLSKVSVGRVSKTARIQPKISSAPTLKPVLTLWKSDQGASPTKLERKLSPSISQTVLSHPSVHANAFTTVVTSPVIQSSVDKVSPSTQLSSRPKVTPIAPGVSSLLNQSTVDLKYWKRQQRMIKNRESASLSRKKKKEYLASLEAEVRDVKNENHQLKEENEKLQQRVSLLEQELQSKKVTFSHRKTTATALLGVTFLFALNVVPLVSLMGAPGLAVNLSKGISPLEAAPESSAVLRRSESVGEKVLSSLSRRSLLWISSLKESSEAMNQSSQDQLHTCPLYVNATESLRIENELRDWFEQKLDIDEEPPKALHPKTESERQKANLQLLDNVDTGEDDVLESKEYPIPSLGKALLAPPTPGSASQFYPYIYDEPAISSGLKSVEQPPSNDLLPPLGPFQSLFDAINRRDDTYYVVSFSSDHLLIPALSHNTSARPRMSLLVPTATGLRNGSAERNDSERHDLSKEVSFMQIDCEVMHTRVIQVSKEFFPFRKASMRETTHDESLNAADMREKSNRKRRFTSKFKNKTKAGIH